MTIKTRNRSLISIFSLSVASASVFAVLSAVSAARGALARPDFLFARGFWRGAVTGWRLGALMAAPIALALCAAAASLLSFFWFEKTQSGEIVFFALFLLSCMAESARLLVPLFGLWRSASALAARSAQVVLFGRFLAPLSLVFAASLGGSESRGGVDRNALFALAVSLAAALVIPVNTAAFLPDGGPRWWRFGAVSSVIFILHGAALAAFCMEARDSGRPARSVAPQASLSAGFLVCCHCSSYLALAVGCAALFGGAFFYLRALRRRYLWL